jgi:hypothetical protein
VELCLQPLYAFTADTNTNSPLSYIPLDINQCQPCMRLVLLLPLGMGERGLELRSVHYFLLSCVDSHVATDRYPSLRNPNKSLQTVNGKKKGPGLLWPVVSVD